MIMATWTPGHQTIQHSIAGRLPPCCFLHWFEDAWLLLYAHPVLAHASDNCVHVRMAGYKLNAFLLPTRG